MKYEIRTIGTQPAKLVGRTLSGIAIPYNALSHDLGGFKERFLPGSVTDAIQSGRMEAWAHHDPTKPVGSQAAGNLRLTDSPVGMLYDLELPEGNTDADNVVSLARSDKGKPIIGGTSFGFRIAGPDGQQWKRENGENIREVLKADVNHISPVVTPAYPQTSALLRSLSVADIETIETYGIDLSALSKILVSVKRGLNVDEIERELVRKAIMLLRGTLHTPRLERAMKDVSRLLI